MSESSALVWDPGEMGMYGIGGDPGKPGDTLRTLDLGMQSGGGVNKRTK